MAATQSGPRTTGEILNTGFPSQENSNIDFPNPLDRFPDSWCNTEEAHEKEPIDLEKAWNGLELENKIFLIVRCVMTFLCFVAIIGMFVGIGRSRRFRYKSWRLYMFTSIMVLTWLCLSLYYDHIDRHFVREIDLHPQRDIIYTCIMNLVQGMSLFLIVLLLSHLSDFQHRGSWLWLIALVVVVPGVYSIVLLLVELFGLPQKCEIKVGEEDLSRNGFAISTAKITIKIAFYNVATIILLLVFSRNLCTKRLYGTYSEHRSPLAVLISRWTFAFLILHNLTEIASYGALIASKGEVCTDCWEVAIVVEGILKEVAFLLVLLAVPCSYLIAFLAHCVLGVDDESTLVEMEKIDKVYQEDFPDLLGSEVWTPSAGSTTTQIQNQPLPQPSNGAIAGGRNPTSNPSGQSRNGNNSRPPGPDGSRAGSQSTLNSTFDSVGELPSGGRNPQGSRTGSRMSNRQSYMEAVSMGSLDGGGSDRYSVTTDPIDL